MTKKRFELCANGIDCYHIEDLNEGKIYRDYDFEDICDLLNKINDEYEQLKYALKNSEPISDQKELQKLIYQTIINLIDSDEVDTLTDLKELLQKQL